MLSGNLSALRQRLISAVDARYCGAQFSRRHFKVTVHRLTTTHVNWRRRIGSSSANHACAEPRSSADSNLTLDTLPELVLSDAQRRTIYALSSPPGKAGVGVIRISGQDVLDVWQKMVRPSRRSRKGKEREQEPEPWTMHRCQVVHPTSGEVLDDGLAVYFKGPRSFTGEDVLELHVHSGRAVISSVLSALSCFPHCRLAEPGEFTRRAFTAGRIDLTQVEGLKDLINAETESQRKVALKAAGGTMRTWSEQLRTDVIKCLGLVEALIDFGEEDVEEGVYEQARDLASKILAKIQAQLSDARRGEILRSGVKLAIFGPPNAGKSTLLNFLAQREAAIVTNIPGTTRDILEISLDIGGLPVIVADTAGLRKTDDIVETIGIERATNAVANANVSLCILSLSEATALNQMLISPGAPFDIPDNIASLISPEKTFLLLNKADLLPSQMLNLTQACTRFKVKKAWTVSLTTGEGTQIFLDEFGKALQEQYGILQDQASDETAPVITHSRQRVHLEAAVRFLEAFLDAPYDDLVLAAEELRYAAQAVGKVSGRIDVEDVLDSVFRDFCIGK